MKDFLDKDFLLESDVAKKLFHEYAEKMPICDYHCHLSPKEIYENNQPNNISDLWLSGDHYKWRAMRSCGVEEKYCTGDASPKEKFEKFAYTLQYCIGNPLYHWAHIELQRYFGIDTPLNAKLRMIFMSVQIRQLPMVILLLKALLQKAMSRLFAQRTTLLTI